MKNLTSTSSCKEKGPNGFTLIEFVVIISIFAIMAGVALVNFTGFKSNVALNNLAHDIALTIRQAQVFGWSTQSDTTGNNGEGMIQFENGDPAGNPIRYADGVYFHYDTNAFTKEIILYVKNNSTPGLEYYQENVDSIIDTIKIQGPIHIAGIRFGGTKTDLLLDNGQIPQDVVSVEVPFSVAFSRPRPEAMFFSSTMPLTGVDTDFVAIYVSADGDAPGVAQKVITISRFGEIAVQ